MSVLKEWLDEYFVESDHGGGQGAVVLVVDVVKFVGSGLCFGCYRVDIRLECEAFVECYTKEFGMFSGWNWFIVYFEWGGGGGVYSLVYLCTRPVMISSVVLFSFKLILDFPQKAAIRLSDFCSLV